jgi:hypothetical protein
MKNNKVEKQLLSAICYFDVFDYPLTLLEIWQWIFDVNGQAQKVDLLEIKNALKNLTTIIDNKRGFYFLRGRESIILKRLKRYAIAGDKNSIAKKGIRVLRFLPFIKLIGVCNNSGNNNTRRDSDIDLFIVTASGRLYVVRFFVTTVLTLMRLRRHGKKVTDRLCLSFYSSEDDLNFEKLKIAEKDPYLIYWIANLFPLYDCGGYEEFISQNNWIRKYLPNYNPKSGSYMRRVDDSKLSVFLKKFMEKILDGFLGNWLEIILKKIQLFKMSQNEKSLARENDTRVIISDTMLKFHENDRRLIYKKEFENRLKNLL